MDDQSVLAWAYSNVAVDTPADPESTFSEHTDCESFVREMMSRSLTGFQSSQLASSASTTLPRTSVALLIRTTSMASLRLVGPSPAHPQQRLHQLVPLYPCVPLCHPDAS